MITVMSVIALLASQPAFDVGTKELNADANRAAIAAIASNDEIESDDPARLINLGIAHARIGNIEVARQMFTTVIANRDGVEMETATGDWVDSRQLARRALRMLETGELGSRIASR